jgi:hypothetical protein
LPEIKPPLLFKIVFFCSNIAPNAVDTHLIKCCFGFVWNSRIICAIGDEEVYDNISKTLFEYNSK